MFDFENSLVIEKPIEQVFSFVADLPSIPKWNYYVMNVISTSSNPGTVGSTYHQVRREDEQDLRISEIKTNELLILETIPPSRPELHREITFEDRGDRTKITDKWQLDLGVPRLLEPIAANRARSGVRENLQKLKTLLESGKVTLQDGRSFSL